MANTCMRSSLPRCPWFGRILPSIMQSNSLSPAHIHSLLHPSIHYLIHQIFIDYLLYARYAWKSLSRVQLFATPWNSPGQNTGVGRLSLLQGIFLTQESNWGLLHCRRILYQLSYQGKTIALTRGTFVGKVMSLHFNILSKLVITFLPTSKCLLLSWLSWGNAFYMLSTRVLGRLLLLHKWSRVGIKVRLLESNSGF